MLGFFPILLNSIIFSESVYTAVTAIDKGCIKNTAENIRCAHWTHISFYFIYLFFFYLILFPTLKIQKDFDSFSYISNQSNSIRKENDPNWWMEMYLLLFVLQFRKWVLLYKHFMTRESLSWTKQEMKNIF